MLPNTCVTHARCMIACVKASSFTHPVPGDAPGGSSQSACSSQSRKAPITQVSCACILFKVTREGHQAANLKLPKDRLSLSLSRWPSPDVRSKNGPLSWTPHLRLPDPQDPRLAGALLCQIRKDEGAMQMHQSRNRCLISAT